MKKAQEENVKNAIEDTEDILDSILTDFGTSTPEDSTKKYNDTITLTEQQKADLAKLQKAVNKYRPTINKISAIFNTAQMKSIIGTVTSDKKTLDSERRAVCTCASEGKRAFANFDTLVERIKNKSA